MFYHNVSRRTTFFDHDFDNMPHCHCFDCRSELHILESYIKLRQEPKNHERLVRSSGTACARALRVVLLAWSCGGVR